MASVLFKVNLEQWGSQGWYARHSRSERGEPGDSAATLAWDMATDHDGLLPDQRITVARDGDNVLTVTPESLALVDPRRGHVARAGKAKHRPRVKGPVFEVVNKVVPTTDLLGKRVLVSHERNNQVGEATPGCTYRAAAYPSKTARPVRVRGVGELTLRGRRFTTLHTEVGEIRLAPGTGVIPS